MAQDVHAHALVDAGRGARRTAGGVQDGRLDRLVLVATWKQKPFGMRKTPIAAQDAEQLLGQHDVALLAALAAFDPDDHAAAVDVGRLQTDHLRHPQPCGIGGGQRDASFETRDGFKKANDFIGAQHGRQLARLTGVGDPLRDRLAAERYAVEETQRAHDLIERRPGDALRNQMHLVGADVFQPEPIRRGAEISAEFRDCVDVRLLGRWRQIADGHILNHPATQRAHVGHLKLLSERGLRTPHPLRQEDRHAITRPPPFTAPPP